MNAASSSSPAVLSKKTAVLMVCLGNICRSPAAEAVLRNLVEKANATDAVTVDSCGTGGGSDNWYLPDGFAYHEGDRSDSRMRAAASKRGINITSLSRPLCAEDFDKFDYIVAMDESNVEDIEKARLHWGVKASAARVVLLSEFSSDAKIRGKPVPDPYWSGASGFELALDLIQEACQGLLSAILREQAQAVKPVDAS